MREIRQQHIWNYCSDLEQEAARWEKDTRVWGQVPIAPRPGAGDCGGKARRNNMEGQQDGMEEGGAGRGARRDGGGGWGGN